MILFFIFAAAILHIILAFWVWKIPKKHTATQKFFIIFSLVTATWLFSDFILFQFHGLINLRTSYAIGSLMAVTALIWVIFFTRKNLTNLQIFIIYGIGLIFFIASYLPNGLVRSQRLIGEHLYSFEIGAWYYPYIIYAALIVLTIFWLLTNAFLKAKGIYREQTRYILIGAILFGGERVISDTFSRNQGLDIFTFFDSVCALLFTFCAAYAVVKYRFMDVRFALRKGTVYAITTAIIIGVYIYILLIATRFAENAFSVNYQIVNIFLIISVIFGFRPLQKMVESVLNAYIFPKRQDQKEVLKLIQSKLIEKTATFENILKTLRKEVGEFCGDANLNLITKETDGWKPIAPSSLSIDLKISSESPLISFIEKNPEIIVAAELPFKQDEATNDEEKRKFQDIEALCVKNDIAVIIPVMIGKDAEALLTLSSKKSDGIYSINDLKFLTNLSQDITPTIAGALMYYQAVERMKYINK